MIDYIVRMACDRPAFDKWFCRNDLDNEWLTCQCREAVYQQYIFAILPWLLGLQFQGTDNQGICTLSREPDLAIDVKVFLCNEKFWLKFPMALSSSLGVWSQIEYLSSLQHCTIIVALWQAPLDLNGLQPFDSRGIHCDWRQCKYFMTWHKS